jgi:hypothetical protein
MQTLKILFTLILFSFIGEIYAQENFEGKVLIDVEYDGEKQNIIYQVKDLRFRMETKEAEGAMVFDSRANKMYIIMDEQKAYIEHFMLPLNDNTTGSYTNTGETKNILGYACEKFLFQQDDTKGEAWMTKDLGGFILFGNRGSGVSGWKRDVLDAGYFPLHVTELDESGNVKGVFKVTQIVPGKLDNELFLPPSSYQKFEMPGMDIEKFME